MRGFVGQPGLRRETPRQFTELGASGCWKPASITSAACSCRCRRYQYSPLTVAPRSSLTASQVCLRCLVSRLSGAPGPPISVGTQPAATSLFRTSGQCRATTKGERRDIKLAFGIGSARVPAPLFPSRCRAASRCPMHAAADVDQATGTLDQCCQHHGASVLTASFLRATQAFAPGSARDVPQEPIKTAQPGFH